MATRRRPWVVLPLLLLAWGCDGPSCQDCPPATGASASAPDRQAEPPQSVFMLPDVAKMADNSYVLKTESIVALLTHTFECGARATRLPGAGYRLDLVPRGSPLEQLGLTSGDEVRAIAEITLTSPSSLYRAYRAARDKPFFHLQGQRGGAPLRIDYLLADPQPSCPPCEQAKAEPPPPLDDKTKRAIGRGIRKQPDGSYQVSRKALDTVLDHQAQLMQEARVLPMLEAGQVVGLRLAGLGQDGLLTRLGLDNDDVLVSVNGFSIASPRQALEAYEQLRDVKQIDLKIKRQGKERTLTYRLDP